MVHRRRRGRDVNYSRRDGCRQHIFRRFRHPGQPGIGLATAQAVEHERDAVERRFQRLEELGRRRRNVALPEVRFHQVRELAQAHRAGHARAALQRMQRAAQLADRLGVLRITSPSAQFFASLREQLRRLVEKDRQDLFIDVVANCRQRVFLRQGQADIVKVRYRRRRQVSATLAKMSHNVRCNLRDNGGNDACRCFFVLARRRGLGVLRIDRGLLAQFV